MLLPNVVLGRAGLEEDEGGGGDGDMGGGMERGVTSGGTDAVDDISTVGWMGAEQGNAQCLDKVILDGWDGDYPDGYGPMGMIRVMELKADMEILVGVMGAIIVEPRAESTVGILVGMAEVETVRMVEVAIEATKQSSSFASSDLAV